MADLFFVLSKTLWALVKPETWLGLLIAASLLALLANKRRIATGCLVICGLFYLALAVFPVGDLLLAPLERQFAVRPPVQSADYILVLGGGEDIEQTEAAGLANLNEAGDRLLAAIELAISHPQAEVILSGASSDLTGTTLSVAEIAGEVLAAAGINPDRLILETASRNTAENATLSAQMAGVDRSRPVVLVTSAFHMPRSVGALCAAGWTNVIPYPVDHRAGNTANRIGWKFAVNLEGLNLGVHEWLGLIAYRLTGRTRHLLPLHC